SVIARLAYHLAYQIRPVERLAEIGFAGKADHRAVGAGADERGGAAHEDAPRWGARRRRLGEGQGACLEVLDEDLHGRLLIYDSNGILNACRLGVALLGRKTGT